MRDIYIILSFLLYTEIHCSNNETESCTSNLMHRPPCNEKLLIEFLADTQIINPESIVDLAVDNVQPMCRKLCKHLRKLDEYLKRCRLRSEDSLYLSLINGVKVLYNSLCTDSEFSRRYQNHYHCLHELRNDFEGCNAPADWNEETDKNQICTDYKNMVDCYYVKAAKVCGLPPANTIKQLMRYVVDAVIKVKCAGIDQNPYVKDPMPSAYLKYAMMMDFNKAEIIQIFSKVKVAMFLNVLILYMNQ